jgi:hypothetical protein
MLQSGFVIYLLFHTVRGKQQQGRNLGHFTIPILSPFSSVVSLYEVSSSPGVDYMRRVRTNVTGGAGNLAYRNSDANCFSRRGGRIRIFSYSYLAAGPKCKTRGLCVLEALLKTGYATAHALASEIIFRVFLSHSSNLPLSPGT